MQHAFSLSFGFSVLRTVSASKLELFVMTSLFTKTRFLQLWGSTYDKTKEEKRTRNNLTNKDALRIRFVVAQFFLCIRIAEAYLSLLVLT